MYNRIPKRVGICVDSTAKPDRIALDVPACDRVIVPKVVVIQPGLFVKVLARQYYDTMVS